jgi:hypothetical protein
MAFSILYNLAVGSNPSLPLPAHYIPVEINTTLGHGRNDVHGWLWLPKDTVQSSREPVSIVEGYWYHHTPEFGTQSPHDFEIMVEASLSLDTPVKGLPLPPEVPVMSTEYVFTPPAFSLDELITGETKAYYGHFTNGSFDTAQYYTLSNGTLTVNKISTVHYLYDGQSNATIAEQAYLSYPRSSGKPVNSKLHLYWLHLLWSGRGTGEAGSHAPDYDQMVHVTIDLDSCNWMHGDSPIDATQVGATFTTDMPNQLSNRLHTGTHRVTLQTEHSRGQDNKTKTSCVATVMEELHCVVMPDSLTKCPPPSVLL